MSTLNVEKKYHLLLNTLQKARNTLDLNETLRNLLEYIKTVVDYDAAGIFVLNREIPAFRSSNTESADCRYGTVRF
jgi:hypothetical protein